MSHFKKITLFIVLSFMTACAASATLSPMQRRALQTKTFEKVSYDNVFRAFKTVLQDEGYIIKNQDMAGGLIVATIQKTDSSGLLFSIFSNANNFRTGESFELSINLEKINTSIVESRLVIQKVDTYNQGGQQGREILDPKMYKTFYEKVAVEIERRKAQGK